MLEGLGTRIEKDCLLDKYRQPHLNAAYMKDWAYLTQKFLKALPYSLTVSQMKAIAEIIWDLKRPIPMNRLLQVSLFQLFSCILSFFSWKQPSFRKKNILGHAFLSHQGILEISHL